MAPRLPDDVLFEISTQLADQGDFHTLFNCAVSSKILTVPALRNLYRVQDKAPIKDDDSQTHTTDGIARWAKLWRSLILSSMSKTAYPYCRYIRVLDLNDLADLLQEPKFRNEYSNQFFQGDLEQFFVKLDMPTHTKLTRNMKARGFLDNNRILDKVGEAIAAQAPMVEELITGVSGESSEISRESLLNLIPRMRHLRLLRLVDGLKLRDVGTLLSSHCHNFRALRFYRAGPGADAAISQLLEALTPNTLEAFEIFSTAEIESEVFSSLNKHSESLTELKLGDLNRSCLPSLAELKHCTALKQLSFTVKRYGQTPSTSESRLPEIVDWLQSCNHLEELYLDGFEASVQILPQLLLHPTIKLKQLKLLNYDSSAAGDFHRALPHQSDSLASLVLRADGETCDTDVLVSSLCHLTHLNEVELRGISDDFTDVDIKMLADHLPYLEDVWISGWRITDSIWSSFNHLASLRRLDINALSAFTLEGILDFVSKLGPGNQGMLLSVMMANPISALSDEEQALVQDSIGQRVDGRFEYQLGRDPDAESDESDSD